MHLVAGFLVVAAMDMTFAVAPVHSAGFSLVGFFAGRTNAAGSFRAITGFQRTFTASTENGTGAC